MCAHSHVQSHEGHKELPECPLPLALCSWTPQALAVGLAGADSALILHTEGQFLGIYTLQHPIIGKAISEDICRPTAAGCRTSRCEGLPGRTRGQQGSGFLSWSLIRPVSSIFV